MTTQPLLTDDQVTQLARAVVMAGIAVAAAKWSGDSGTASELSVIGKRFYDEAAKHPANPVIQAISAPAARLRMDELVAQFRDTTSRRLEDVRPFTLRRCDEAAEMLASISTPEQAEEVKQTIIATCYRVAEESKEGAFLGVGGQRVSPEETAIINEIARALKAKI
jgi:hypothetical protein